MRSDSLDDGFGNIWEKCRAKECDLEIVRPGKVQCSGYCDTAGWKVDSTYVDGRRLARPALLWIEARWSDVSRWTHHVLHLFRQSDSDQFVEGREWRPYRRVHSMLQRTLIKPNERCEVGYQDHMGEAWRCVLPPEHGGWHKAKGYGSRPPSHGSATYAEFEWHPDDHRNFTW